MESDQEYSRQFSCPKSDCSDYGKLGGANITLYTRYGRRQLRLFKCNTCTTTFNELRGTPFWDARIDSEIIAKIYRSLIDGLSIRGTARRHNLSKNTVKRYLRLAQKDLLSVETFLIERSVLQPDTSDKLMGLVNRHANAASRVGSKRTAFSNNDKDLPSTTVQ